MQVDLSLFAASEQEAIGVEHFLVEPKCNQNLLGGAFDFEAFHSQKFFDVEDFSGAIEYDEIKADFSNLSLSLSLSLCVCVVVDALEKLCFKLI